MQVKYLLSDNNGASIVLILLIKSKQVERNLPLTASQMYTWSIWDFPQIRVTQEPFISFGKGCKTMLALWRQPFLVRKRCPFPLLSKPNC